MQGLHRKYTSRANAGEARGISGTILAKLSSSVTVQTLGNRLRGETRRADKANSAHIVKRLNIPMPDTTPEDDQTRELTDQGRHYVRQDKWDELGKLICKHDAARSQTDGGMAYADLLAFGARSDVVHPVEAALNDPGLMSAHVPRAGLAEFEEILEDYPENYGVALVVAHAYIDIGWAWRGHGWPSEVPARNWQEFQRHFARAADILDTFDPFEQNSPALAAARCALLAAAPAPQTRVADDYEDLIDLDPTNPRPMRAFGNHLLPRWFGNYGQLELEARRTASRTADIWGAGAYTWVYLDAIAVDPNALKLLDIDFFLDGMQAILSRRPDQHTANTMAAYSALTLGDKRYDKLHGISRLRDAFSWILSNHLREVHPLVWGLAALPPHTAAAKGANDIAASGKTEALLRIARHFERDLKQGAEVIMSDHGPLVRHPSV